MVEKCGKPEMTYSQLSNKSTGTMEKNLPKSLAVLTFSCGTIGKNSNFLLRYFYLSGTITLKVEVWENRNSRKKETYISSTLLSAIYLSMEDIKDPYKLNTPNDSKIQCFNQTGTSMNFIPK